MMSRMRYINRWGLMRNTINENNSEHSLDVAMIAHALGVINNVYFNGDINPERLAVLGLYHDATEIITGDMPTPIKYYNPAIRAAYDEVELVAKDELLEGLPDKLRSVYGSLLHKTDEESLEWQYVKAADKISAYIKCVGEINMGNNDFSDAYTATRESIDRITLPEVKFFMDSFMDAYNMTIDKSRK